MPHTRYLSTSPGFLLSLYFQPCVSPLQRCSHCKYNLWYVSGHLQCCQTKHIPRQYIASSSADRTCCTMSRVVFLKGFHLNTNKNITHTIKRVFWIRCLSCPRTSWARPTPYSAATRRGPRGYIRIGTPIAGPGKSCRLGRLLKSGCHSNGMPASVQVFDNHSNVIDMHRQSPGWCSSAI